MSEFSYDRDWKLRIVVAKDLTPGQQLAQGLHAAIEFTQDHPELTKHWHGLSNSVVCMESNDLEKLLEQVRHRNIKLSIFTEPDLDNRLTAIALEPTAESRRITSSLRLAMKGL